MILFNVQCRKKELKSILNCTHRMMLERSLMHSKQGCLTVLDTEPTDQMWTQLIGVSACHYSKAHREISSF